MKDTADAMEVVIEREVASERSELDIAKNLWQICGRKQRGE